ncbi:hypothetical protein BC938DRAFT_476972 [Jimgerdemannia flammicorona]|uniref:Uncharacterized protein n=1 Tax=Jimgerdemannia flammicorona TaxID=994334 RepID=A0A433PD17_9FUNG|nr:hypothetical protein BC938DRAFT_476972 [Jimgerdemannia flammicorona]
MHRPHKEGSRKQPQSANPPLKLLSHTLLLLDRYYHNSVHPGNSMPLLILKNNKYKTKRNVVILCSRWAIVIRVHMLSSHPPRGMRLRL